MTAAAEHLKQALDHHSQGREEFRRTRAALARVAQLVDRAQAAMRLGNDAGVRDRLCEILEAAEAGSESHTHSGVAFSRVRRAVAAAKDELGG
jgi:hypothetical protein